AATDNPKTHFFTTTPSRLRLRRILAAPRPRCPQDFLGARARPRDALLYASGPAESRGDGEPCMTSKTIKSRHPAVRDDIADLTTRRPVPGAEIEQVDPFLFLNHHGPQV